MVTGLSKRRPVHCTIGTTSMTVCESTIPFSDAVKKLWVCHDTELKMSDQSSYVCKVTSLELRRISSIRHLLDTAATKKLALSLVISRLDHWKISSSRPSSVHDQKTPAYPKLHSKIHPKSTQIWIHKQLHWLPVCARILCKHNYLAFSASTFLDLYRPSRFFALRKIPSYWLKFNCKTKGDRSFFSFGAKSWNSLPSDIRHATTLDTFKCKL